MRISLIALLVLICNNSLWAQLPDSTTLRPNELVELVHRSQQRIVSAHYTVERTDTLLTGDTRTMTGEIMLQVAPSDSIYGFYFYARQDGINSELVYDGHVAYITNTQKKEYQISLSSSGIRELASTGGGRLSHPDFTRMDTTGASGFGLKEDEKYFYLTIHRPDLKQYEVINRRKILTIDKLTMLPMAVREHQENFGKTQDLYYKITRLTLNERNNYSFASPPFLSEYKQHVPFKKNHQTLSLLNKPLPPFILSTFEGSEVSSADFKGQLVLLDFWELWCGPCVVAMPKIESIYQKYKNRGLQVYGVVNDLRQVESAIKVVRTRSLSFPNLIGNDQLKKDLRLDGGVPMYVLIDRLGNVTWINWGDAPDMEEKIARALD